MRIIKTGEMPNKEKEVTCYNCNTEFDYTPEDVKPDIDGAYVVCPTCGKFINDK